ncbi:hypothetical protein [Corynebacterium sp. A21]|uniref:hypothetical protein n=1 Tax=Corynebacterium sp. A21 TaxID=3457318 RepID=UPI003FD209AA
MLEPARFLHRGYAFGLDALLLSLLFALTTLATPLEPLEDNFIYLFLLGSYRVVLEFFLGSTIGKAMLRLRVYYFDRQKQPHRAGKKLVLALLRNSWLLVMGLSWFWSPDSNFRSLLVILAVVVAFLSYRLRVVARNLNAEVLHIKPLSIWEDLD